jgi:hypothetical protein
MLKVRNLIKIDIKNRITLMIITFILIRINLKFIEVTLELVGMKENRI